MTRRITEVASSARSETSSFSIRVPHTPISDASSRLEQACSHNSANKSLTGISGCQPADLSPLADNPLGGFRNEACGFAKDQLRLQPIFSSGG